MLSWQWSHLIQISGLGTHEGVSTLASKELTLKLEFQTPDLFSAHELFLNHLLYFFTFLEAFVYCCSKCIICQAIFPAIQS